MKFSDELILFLKARYPIIYISSHEEDRLEYIVRKSIKSILSTRQVSDIRDSLFKKINTDSISIFRYLKCNGPDCEDDSSILWYDLIGEYKKTYISFVVETNYGHWSSNSFTEKTLLSFLFCISISVVPSSSSSILIL